MMNFEGNLNPQNKGESSVSEAQNGRLEQVMDVIPATGMSGDYVNDYSGLFMFVQTGGIQAVIKAIKSENWLPKTYEEVFPLTEYENPVNDKNRARVERLNAIVIQFRKRIDENVDTLTIDELNEYNTVIRKCVYSNID